MNRILVGAACLAIMLLGSLSGCGQQQAPVGGEPVGTATVEAVQPVDDVPRTSSADGSLLVTCGDLPFPVSAMRRGIDPVADREEIVAALDDLAAQAGMDAPKALQDKSANEAEWIVLAETDSRLTVATGPWSEDGPAPDGQVVRLENVGNGWKVTGWGDCTLTPVAPEGAIWAEVTAEPDALSASATRLPVWVSERECTSGRDPSPFLNAPVVVESEGAVTVYWTSRPPEGAQSCPGNPRVKRFVELQDPLGNRPLLDGSTWPPTPAARTPR